MLATSGAFAQAVTDVAHATLVTHMNHLIALRPYSDYVTTPGDQQLVTTITNATDVLNGNNFTYTGNSNYNGLAYKIYSNSTYTVNMEADLTGNQPGDEMNNYINYHVENLPSPQNGLGGYALNGNQPNGDNTIDVATDARLSTATGGAGTQILHNFSYNTGKYAGGGAYTPLEPVNTDFAAFGIKFSASPGFAVFPGDFTTHLTITATSL